eukprot:Gb_34354 [translate_table: standard]
MATRTYVISLFLTGVVTYVKEDLSPLDARADYLGDFNIDEDLCREGRLMETDHGSFVLINVYVPHGGECAEGRPRLNFKLHFLKALKYRCDELVNSGKEIVVLGDFNIAHRDIDVYKNWNIHDLYIPVIFLEEFQVDLVYSQALEAVKINASHSNESERSRDAEEVKQIILVFAAIAIRTTVEGFETGVDSEVTTTAAKIVVEYPRIGATVGVVSGSIVAQIPNSSWSCSISFSI